jgi:ubiquinone/menaquinone biosynthesis C-methylase UbiE
LIKLHTFVLEFNKLANLNSIEWKIQESKSYENWSKLDNFAYIFLFNKVLEIAKSIGYVMIGKYCVEICCGPGVEMQFLSQREKMQMVGVDLSKSNVQHTKAKPEIYDGVRGDAENLPLKSESFEVGLSTMACTIFQIIMLRFLN